MAKAILKTILGKKSAKKSLDSAAKLVNALQ
jgi:hypothetical protein